MVSLDGVAARKGNRHAFVWERVYDLVARDSEHGGSSLFTKQELAKHSDAPFARSTGQYCA